MRADKNKWTNRIIEQGMEDPAQLVMNPKNWRIHNDQQQQALGKALDKIGWVRPILVNKATGLVIDGHLRVKLAKEAGENQVPVEYVNLTSEEENYALMTLDPLSALADENAEKLLSLIDSVEEEAKDYFKPGVLEEIMAKIEQEKEVGDIDLDEEFDRLDEDTIATKYECPRCKYKWS